MRKLLSLWLIIALASALFAGCNKSTNNTLSDKSPDSIINSTQQNESTSNPVEVDFSKIDSDMFTNRDTKTEYDTNSNITISLNGTSASSNSKSVNISGSTVTITQEATYVISGELSDGSLVINAPDTAKLQLVLNGVNITSKTSAALYILQADKVFITLADGTNNTLSNGGEFVAIDDNNIDAALFSKQDLTINGGGALTVTSPVGHGIVCKDDLVITGGNYTVNCASHGLDANDSVRIADASFTINAGKDAIHAENNDDASKGFIYISGGTINATAEGDGISAGAYMQIEGGTINLLVGGGSENGDKQQSDSFGGFMGGGRPGGMRAGGMQSGSTTTTNSDSTSMKGLKATSGLLISNGSITVNSADDAIHSDTSVTINGGTFVIASGDDAIHAEENLTVTAGKIDISQSYEGLEALHIDIKGGDIKLIATDDGLNAAGGTDQSGFTGGRDGMFGGGRPGGMGGMSSNSNGSIKISGGNIYVQASGDGLDANGTLEISGGYTVVTGPTRGDTATLDYDKSATISGGTFIGTGASGMAQSFSDSSQGVIAVSVGNQSANTNITLKDSNGNTIVNLAPELDFAVAIISDPKIEKGKTYTLTVGSLTDKITAN